MHPTRHHTIEFRYDATHDVVVAQPRWILETPSDVVRWHEAHARYFNGRFARPKDLVTLNEELDIAPKVATIWGLYRSKLHESAIRHAVGVKSNPRVRLSTNTSGARYGISSLEAPTLEAAFEIIATLRARAAAEYAETAARNSNHDALRKLGVSERSEPRR